MQIVIQIVRVRSESIQSVDTAATKGIAHFTQSVFSGIKPESVTVASVPDYFKMLFEN